MSIISVLHYNSNFIFLIPKSSYKTLCKNMFKIEMPIAMQILKIFDQIPRCSLIFTIQSFYQLEPWNLHYLAIRFCILFYIFLYFFRSIKSLDQVEHQYKKHRKSLLKEWLQTRLYRKLLLIQQQLELEHNLKDYGVSKIFIDSMPNIQFCLFFIFPSFFVFCTFKMKCFIHFNSL